MKATHEQLYLVAHCITIIMNKKSSKNKYYEKPGSIYDFKSNNDRSVHYLKLFLYPFIHAFSIQPLPVYVIMSRCLLNIIANVGVSFAV